MDRLGVILAVAALMLVGAGCLNEPTITADDAYDAAADASYDVMQLRYRVDDLESRLDDLESNGYSNSSRISDLEDEVSYLQWNN